MPNFLRCTEGRPGALLGSDLKGGFLLALMPVGPVWKHFWGWLWLTSSPVRGDGPTALPQTVGTGAPTSCPCGCRLVLHWGPAGLLWPHCGVGAALFRLVAS